MRSELIGEGSLNSKTKKAITSLQKALRTVVLDYANERFEALNTEKIKEFFFTLENEDIRQAAMNILAEKNPSAFAAMLSSAHEDGMRRFFNPKNIILAKRHLIAKIASPNVKDCLQASRDLKILLDSKNIKTDKPLAKLNPKEIKTVKNAIKTQIAFTARGEKDIPEKIEDLKALKAHYEALTGETLSLAPNPNCYGKDKSDPLTREARQAVSELADALSPNIQTTRLAAMTVWLVEQQVDGEALKPADITTDRDSSIANLTGYITGHNGQWNGEEVVAPEEKAEALYAELERQQNMLPFSTKDRTDREEHLDSLHEAFPEQELSAGKSKAAKQKTF